MPATRSPAVLLAASAALLVAVALGAALAAGLVPPLATSPPAEEPPPDPRPVAVAERRVPQPEPPPLEPFDVDNAMRHLRAIEAFGVRQGGGAAEAAAAGYLARELAALGYEPRIDEFPIPGGRTSSNVTVRAEGRTGHVLVLGAHIDSKPPSPGANDNASGVGVLLEIARVLASRPVTATVEIVFFGTEEIVGGPDDHHFGSRHHVAQLTAEERDAVAGMISVDMIAVGEDLHARTMLRGPQGMSDFILALAEETGVPMTFLKDRGRTGWSDHAPFEFAGIPAAAIHRLPDPAYHTAGDTSERIDPERVREVGGLVLDACRALDVPELERLLAR